MNKLVKVCYNSWQCRRSIKIGIGFIIISLVFLAIPMISLFADTLSVPNHSGSDGNGNWVQYNVNDDQKTSYTWFPDKNCTAKGVSFEAGHGINSFQSGFVGTETYDNGYFTITIASDGSSAKVEENNVSGDFKDINSIKIYFECAASAPSRLDWGQNGRDLADLSGCQEGYWHWILTPGGNATILTATLTVTYSNNTQTQTTGGTRSGGANGAFHFDVYHPGITVNSAYVEYTFSGNMNNPVLTISDSSCSETTTTVGETTTSDATTTTVGETTTSEETTTTVGETTTTAGETTTTSGATTTTVGETTTSEETTTTVGETTTTAGETTTTSGATTTSSGETTTTAGGTTTSGATTTTAAGTTTTVAGGTTTTTSSVSVAGIADADNEGFIQVAGVSQLPYTGINSWFLIIGVLFVIAGILSIIIPKYYKKVRYNKH